MNPTIKPSAPIAQNAAVPGLGGDPTMLGDTNLMTTPIPTITVVIEKNSARPPFQAADLSLS
ncbi:hypothetical protein BH11GEM2_BH11GEM2_17800 [soil metagenome]